MVRGVWCADFETTTQANLDKDGYVRVWLWSLVETGPNGREFYGTDGKEFIRCVEKHKCKKVLFHNLAFDGVFLLCILDEMGYQFGIDYDTAIDKLGTWYFIQFHGIKFWDSLKKFPDQSVNDVAKLYGIEGKKEKPFFDAYRPVDYKPTKEEIEYCLQDSRIVAYAIEKEYREGHNGITLSADAFNDVKSYIGGKHYWRGHLPLLDKETDWFVRMAYKGGCVQVNPKFQGKDLVGKIYVYDINSMYPYMMATKRLPIDYPKYRTPDFNDERMLWVVRFKTKFKIKPNHIPTIQIRRNPLYKESEYLKEVNEEVELSLTCIDYRLFHDQYDVEYEKDHVYLCFNSKVGLLKPYIDKWMNVKKEATITKNPSLRFIAKRYLNSPYGKTGMRPDRLNNEPYFEDCTLKFKPVLTDSESVYCPYAAFVCAYARDMIVRAAQAHYDSFVYMDTDSLHLLCEGKNLWVDDTELGAFKLENVFEMGKYLRAKTYIHAHRDGDKVVVDEIKCSGMPDEIKKTISYDEFKSGAEFGGKLTKRRVPGGCILTPTTFMIKDDEYIKKQKEKTLANIIAWMDDDYLCAKAQAEFYANTDKSVSEDDIAYLEDNAIKEKDRYWKSRKKKALIAQRKSDAVTDSYELYGYDR